MSTIKEVCNQGACHNAAGVFEIYYAHLPADMRTQMIANKFAAFRERLSQQGTGCDAVECLVLAQLRTIAQAYKEEK